ncbi:MAG: type I-E CRISPR-associated protein Cas5/CasD, partial [Anaerovoracaceae bacterium]
MKTILLKLSGPMQSYGTGSHYNYRRTDPYPSKSAVIGMIMAAYGYRRNDKESDEMLEKLYKKLSFAVRVDQVGRT